MRIEQIMSRPVQFCGPQDTLARAAQLMWDHDCGCLPVCEGDSTALRVVGIITDRDICMCGLFQGKPLAELRVSGAMSKHVLTCTPNDSVAIAEKKMRDAKVRRLPVIDPAGAPVGMISLADLAHEAARERASSTQEITEREVGDTLAVICEPLHRQIAA
jgi:CBS domain-containing protein